MKKYVINNITEYRQTQYYKIKCTSQISKQHIITALR